MKIEQINYDQDNVHVTIAPSGAGDEKISWGHYMLLLERLPGFLADLGKLNPTKERLRTQRANLSVVKSEEPEAPAHAPQDERQVTLDEVLSRSTTVAITQKIEAGEDPDKVAAVFAKELVKIEEAPKPPVQELPPNFEPYRPPLPVTTETETPAEVDAFPEPADAEAKKVWLAFQLDAGVLLTMRDRTAVLPEAASIWKKHRAAIRALGKDFNGSASDHLSRIVGETLSIPTAEAHTLIKAQLAIKPAEVVTPVVEAAPLPPAVVGTVTPPLSSPVEVAATVDPKVAEFLGKLSAKTQTPALKDILQVGCETCVEVIEGKRVVRKSVLTSFFESIKGCHALLEASNWPNVEKILNGTQMPIYAALGQSKARWDAAT